MFIGRCIEKKQNFYTRRPFFISSEVTSLRPRDRNVQVMERGLRFYRSFNAARRTVYRMSLPFSAVLILHSTSNLLDDAPSKVTRKIKLRHYTQPPVNFQRVKACKIWPRSLDLSRR